MIPNLYDADLLNLIRGMDGSEPCTQTDPDLWTVPDYGNNPAGNARTIRRDHQTAKQLCGGCHLRDQCATYALGHDVSGVWGGLTELDRKRLAEDEDAA